MVLPWMLLSWLLMQKEEIWLALFLPCLDRIMLITLFLDLQIKWLKKMKKFTSLGMI